jgi:predicted DNA-binding transcriptional regulator AlpA
MRVPEAARLLGASGSTRYQLIYRGRAEGWLLVPSLELR